jgi:CheY-like chemotaxis protein
MAGFQSGPRARLRVLIVDRNTDAADSAAVLLRLWGFDVRAANSAAHALAEAPAYLPDVLLTEVASPGFDGYGLARRVRELAGDHRIVCIAVTGLGRAEDRQRSDAERFAYHLVKPVDPCQLRNVLQAVGDTRRWLRALGAGTRGMATPSNTHWACSWRTDHAADIKRVHARSVASRSYSERLLEQSRSLRERSCRLYRKGAERATASHGTLVAPPHLLSSL